MSARRLRSAGGAGLALLCLVLSPTGPASAGAGLDPTGGGDAAVAERLGDHLLHSPQLLGDPGGARTRLEELGLSFQLFFTHFLSAKLHGGADPDDTFGHSGSYDWFTLADMQELVGWPGLDLLLRVRGQYDRSVNSDVGALSDPIDDADPDKPIYVSELWAEQAILENRLRLRLGLVEQQTVFDRNAFANSEDRQFMNASLDNNRVVPLPGGLGGMLMARPTDWLVLAIGAGDAENRPGRAGFDTTFDDAEGITAYLEGGLLTHFPGPRGELTGTWRAGIFLDGSEKPVFGRIDPGTGQTLRERGHVGFYLSLDQMLWRESARDLQGLGVFARYGLADERVNSIAQFWSVGLQYAGALPTRGLDVLGLGVYQTLPSSRYREVVDRTFGSETGIELYYRIGLLPWLTLTPDFQYIANPGARDAPDAVVVVLRTRFSF